MYLWFWWIILSIIYNMMVDEFQDDFRCKLPLKSRIAKRRRWLQRFCLMLMMFNDTLRDTSWYFMIGIYIYVYIYTCIIILNDAERVEGFAAGRPKALATAETESSSASTTRWWVSAMWKPEGPRAVPWAIKKDGLENGKNYELWMV